MSVVYSVFRFLSVVLLLGFLAGCETAEERAQAHYERALSLIEEGEVEKAVVEFRNVFKLNGTLIEARFDYVSLMLTEGDLEEAVAHLNLIIEQDPKYFPARKELTRIMLQAQRLDVAEQNLVVALESEPDDLELLGIRASLDYLDESKRQSAIDLASRVIADDPTLVAARMVIIARYADAGQLEEALAEIDIALAYTPAEFQLHLIRLVTLEGLGDTAAAGDQLKKMARQFPENIEVHQALVRWYVGQNDLGGAEGALRDLALTDPKDPSLAMSVVRFLQEMKGIDAARVELQRLSQGEQNRKVFSRALALLEFELGNSDAAFQAAEELLAEGGTESQIADAKVLMAQLLYSSGKRDEALPLIEEVLLQDSSYVDALILRSQVSIGDERPDKAVQDLRNALNQDPESPRILTLLAKAHIRNGSVDLARDRFAQAFDMSKGGPQESLDYANFLVAEERYAIAEDVLVASLRFQPTHVPLLKTLADVRLLRRDWDGALEIAARLRDLGPGGQNLSADSIEISSLSAQSFFDESIARIQRVLEVGSNDRALLALTRLYMKTDQPQKAEEVLRGALAENAQDANAWMLLAAVLVEKDDTTGAERIYRDLIDTQPEFPSSYVLLSRLLLQSNRQSEASNILDAGAEATDGNLEVQLERAGRKELEGDFETAIAIYNDLYEKNPGSPVLANNLASLLAEYRSDEASLERSFRVARRLRNSDNPAFQDTYGWILFRRGNFGLALAPLISAAEGLPDNPIVIFHLGMTLAELGQSDEAIVELEKAIALAGVGSILPQVEQARKKIAELKAPPAE